MTEQSRKELRQLKRREDIIKVAVKICAQKPFALVTIDEIAEAAGYTKGNMYQYFSSREDVFIELTMMAVEKLHELFKNYSSVPKTGMDKLEAIGNAHLHFLSNFPQYHHFLKQINSITATNESSILKMQELRKINQEIAMLMAKCIEIGKQDKTIKIEINTMELTFLLIGASTGVFEVMSSIMPFCHKEFGFPAQNIHSLFMNIIHNYISTQGK